MDFDWKRKSRLQEQLKFFGASKTRFLSCYAKKPKIKVKLKPKLEHNGTNQLKALEFGLFRQANQASALGGAFACHNPFGVSGPAGSAYLAAQAQAAMAGQSHIAAQLAAQGSDLANLGAKVYATGLSAPFVEDL